MSMSALVICSVKIDDNYNDDVVDCNSNNDNDDGDDDDDDAHQLNGL